MTTDTKAVARYEYIGRWVGQHPTGNYVLFTDHERVVGELVTANEELVAECREWLYKWRATETALAASRAEAEGLKKDAERRLDLIRATVENSEWRHGARNIYGELKREIQAADAAMENNNV